MLSNLFASCCGCGDFCDCAPCLCCWDWVSFGVVAAVTWVLGVSVVVVALLASKKN